MLYFLETLIIALLVYFVFSQVILPLFKRTLLFPFFRKRIVLENELREVQEERKNLELEQQIANERDLIKKERDTFNR